VKWRVNWLANIIVVLVILIAVCAVILPGIFSSKLAVVYSGSMAPAMPMGALAWMEPVVPADIEVGDIIAFNPPWRPDDTVSHRVIEVLDDGFRTKGDANEDPDLDIVPAANVIGRVSFNIHHMGYVLERIGRYTRNPLGFGLLICIPTALLIAGASRDMNFMLSPGKRRARRQRKMMERRKKRKSHS